ncbi:MAG: T9SS type A sorting domain-containing protein [candidate division KSB1 bacterium]|nr:T9SS type A sorting domain-containing protein [candidate division KSB1 bacterium]MDZ7304022.1 T9SS type A sorting domain-containing protein [candidate division KSB1 bacterium]MDZ7313268.1 T9SS type A sorting domain-containing protein [candidate division KSB1 bacterium]
MSCKQFNKLVGGIRWSVILFLSVGASTAVAQNTNETPPNFKIAIIADGGLGDSDKLVFQMIKSEGAQAVVHGGDLCVKDGGVAVWDAMITDILGVNFPFFAAIGDDDGDFWDGAHGIQQYLMNRLNRIGIAWDGNLGIKSSLRYKGIFIMLLSPGIRDSGHDLYIREKLAAEKSIWRICSWHKVMRLMQVADKPDGTGWGVYEEARLGGAMTFTGHAHTYTRTHLLSSMMHQTIASTSNTLHIENGKSFVAVSGLAGEGRAAQQLSGDWWAKIYTKTQNAEYGALFAIFNVEGMPNKAKFYFKNIKGEIIDSFTVISHVGSASLNVTMPSRNSADIPQSVTLYPNSPNPFHADTRIRFGLPERLHVTIKVFDVLGREVAILANGHYHAGTHSVVWQPQNLPSGIYYYVLETARERQVRRLLLVR